jgi:long-chain acyl-CoA synthetase
VTVTDILGQRADVERDAGSAAGRTFCGLVEQAAQRWGGEPALSDRDDDGPWQTITWAQARQQALELAAALISLGLQPGERVALMLPNRAEHVLADMAVLHAGGVPVTFYSTLAPDQVAYIAGDCDARIAVLDGAPELARWQQALGLPGLGTVIVRDPSACPAGEKYLTWAGFAALGCRQYPAGAGEVAARVAAIGPGDPVTVLYTSGTTGSPKGVVITHHSVLYELASTDAAGFLIHRPRWVSYLPLAHIAERMFTIYSPAYSGGHVFFCHDTSGLLAALGAVRPTGFFGVPRVWEKIQAGIQALLAGEQDPARRDAVAAAMATGRRYVESCQFGVSTPAELEREFALADESVLKPVRALLGLDEAAMVSSAAAPLPPDVASFFAGLGMKILDVYGMTETTGAFTANTTSAFRLGTVGRVLPGIEIRVAADGEILTRGPLNTPGYVNLPDRTAELIDDEGWLHTGDIGSLDDDGFVSVTDRKKEIIITSGGENVSPAAVENLLVAHPLIGQALSYGDRRPYVVALLTLDADVAPAWARARGITALSLAGLAADPAVLEEAGRAVAQANERLARVQQVKAWRLLPEEWTPDGGELTPTLKVKRRVVHAAYADVIDALYADGDAG